jgi:hypothetical protein
MRSQEKVPLDNFDRGMKLFGQFNFASDKGHLTWSARSASAVTGQRPFTAYASGPLISSLSLSGISVDLAATARSFFLQRHCIVTNLWSRYSSNSHPVQS